MKLLRLTQEFKFKTLTTSDFRDCFVAWCEEKKLPVTIDWEGWLAKTGMPPVDCPFSNQHGERCDALAATWLAAGAEPPHGVSASDVEGWSTLHFQQFLDTMVLKLAEDPSKAPSLKTLQVRLLSL